MRENTVSRWKRGVSNTSFLTLVVLDSLADRTAELERICLQPCSCC